MASATNIPNRTGTVTLGGRILPGDRLLAILFVAPAALILLLTCALPFASVLTLSFWDLHTISQQGEFVGLQNYLRLATSPEFLASMGRGVVWTAGTILFQLVAGIAISVLLNQTLRGRGLARGIMVFPYVVPVVVVVMVFRFMIRPRSGILSVLLAHLGFTGASVSLLDNPYWAMLVLILAGAWKYMPFMIICFLARLQTIPPQLYEAARTDGAGAWRLFWHITLPFLAPVIYITLLLRTIWTFNHFDLIYLLTHGGPGHATTTVPLLIYETTFSGKYELGYAAAMAVVLFCLLWAVTQFTMTRYDRSEATLQ